MIYQSLSYSEKYGFAVLYSGHLDIESGAQSVEASIESDSETIGGLVASWQDGMNPEIVYKQGDVPENVHIPSDYSIKPMISKLWAVPK